MRIPAKRAWRARSQHQPHTHEMLDVLLTLDRMLVEVSMLLYSVPQGDQFHMRKQNRQLHNAVRQQFPRLLKISRSHL